MVRAEVNLAEVEALLREVERAGTNATPAMRDIAHRLRSDILLNFRTGGTFPESWEPSERVKKSGGQTLVDTATLRNSMHPDWGATEAMAGTDVIYGGIHQFGGLCGRGLATRMPARPFLPIDAQDNLRPSTARFAADRLVAHYLGGGAA
jgi:phage virion morphogenesis protein